MHVLDLVHRASASVSRGRELASMPSIVLAEQSGPLARPGSGSVRLRFLGRPGVQHELRFLFATIEESRVAESGGLRLVLEHRRDIERGVDEDDVIAIDALGGLLRPAEGWLDHHPLLRATLPLRSSLAEQLETIASARVRQRLSAISKAGFQWTLTRAPADFDDFYDAMYLPLIQTRHADDAHVIDRADMLRLLRRRGALLRVCEGDRVVCAALVYRSAFEPDTMFYWRGGIRDAAALSPSRLGELNGALEVAMLRYAIEQGYRVFDLGLVRALLNDGAFIHKRRLGCDFRVPEASTNVLLHLRPSRASALVHALPFICSFQGGFEAHLSTDAETDHGAREESELKSTIRDSSFASLRRITLHVSPSSRDAWTVAALEQLQRETGAELRIDAAA